MSRFAMKLFKVTCRGNGWHFEAYVVAVDTQAAYQTLRSHLDAQSIGFAKERELQQIELLAEDVDYPNCERRLYLPSTPLGKP